MAPAGPLGALTGSFDSVTPGYTVQQVGTVLWLLPDAGANGAVAPEPAAVGLALLGLVGLASRRRGGGVLAACLLAALAAPRADAGVVVAGELIVDLRAIDLDAGSQTWQNQDATGATVGSFSTYGGGSLNVAAVAGVDKALHINQDRNNALLSSGSTPANVAGNGSRSVEAWVYAESLAGSQGVVSWGATSTNQFSRFTYAGGGNGLLSGWFNDAGWNGATLPTNEWTHVAWTWDGLTTARGYINGQLVVTTGMGSTATLSTAATTMTLGASRTDASADQFDGYLADIRVHTGKLSDAEVQNNFLEGLAVGPSGVGGDYNNDGVVDAADYTVWRDSSPSDVLMNEAVSPFQSDIADYLYWRERYGATDSGAPAAAASAPEPSALLLAGAFAMAFRGRRSGR